MDLKHDNQLSKNKKARYVSGFGENGIINNLFFPSGIYF